MKRHALLVLVALNGALALWLAWLWFTPRGVCATHTGRLRWHKKPICPVCSRHCPCCCRPIPAASLFFWKSHCSRPLGVHPLRRHHPRRPLLLRSWTISAPRVCPGYLKARAAPASSCRWPAKTAGCSSTSLWKAGHSSQCKGAKSLLPVVVKPVCCNCHVQHSMPIQGSLLPHSLSRSVRKMHFVPAVPIQPLEAVRSVRSKQAMLQSSPSHGRCLAAHVADWPCWFCTLCCTPFF